MRVGIVGGGVTGLTIGYELARSGVDVSVYEKGALGGLAGGFPYKDLPGVFLDKFYHHIFASDEEIVSLIESCGLGEELLWRSSKTGLIADGRIWPFGGAMDLLRFSPLGGIRQRLLMGWSLAYFRRTEDWEELDKIRCREFFENRGRLAGYKGLWEPLLKQKFADAYDDIPASFLWGRIHPRSKSRKKGGESLGYLEGGFQRLILKMAETIRENGGKVLTGAPVEEVKPGESPEIITGEGAETFDRVVWTAAQDKLAGVVKDVSDEAVAGMKVVEYIAATQLILVMERRQSDYYWINNIDPELTFGGLIEHTNLVPPESYNNEHILYVINYHRPGDKRFEGKSAEEVLDFHAPSLEKILPNFKREEIRRLYCMRDSRSSPLYDLGFADRRPPYNGWLTNVDICGMAQVYPEDRNMNHCAANARRYVGECF